MTSTPRNEWDPWKLGALLLLGCVFALLMAVVLARETEIGGFRGSLPGPLLTHLHTVYMAYSDLFK
jgi:hypothetical protein